MSMKQLLIVLTVGVLWPIASTVAAQPPQDAWRDWQVVLGDWVGDEGHGQPGSPTSRGFSFAPELDGHILVRRDRSDYPAAQGRPAFTHEGLMVIYRDEGSKAFRAQAFDNEGHVIEYLVDVVPGRRIVMTSPAAAGAPRYRLVYEATSSGLAISFDIAPPDRPSEFRVYVAGSAHRR